MPTRQPEHLGRQMSIIDRLSGGPAGQENLRPLNKLQSLVKEAVRASTSSIKKTEYSSITWFWSSETDRTFRMPNGRYQKGIFFNVVSVGGKSWGNRENREKARMSTTIGLHGLKFQCGKSGRCYIVAMLLPSQMARVTQCHMAVKQILIMKTQEL